MIVKLRSILAVLISFLMVSCSFFSPIMLEQHQWGSLVFYDGYRHIDQEHSNTQWDLTYESGTQTTFNGLVRHTTRINSGQFPMLTHDILVTTGDFADSTIVRTSVMNHRFMWSSRASTKPVGTINLLHTIPKNEDILNALYSIKHGDTVTITGYEILTIDRIKNGVYKGQWKDAGCNTILVTSVSIINTP